MMELLSLSLSPRMLLLVFVVVVVVVVVVAVVYVDVFLVIGPAVLGVSNVWPMSVLYVG